MGKEDGERERQFEEKKTEREKWMRGLREDEKGTESEKMRVKDSGGEQSEREMGGGNREGK